MRTIAVSSRHWNDEKLIAFECRKNRLCYKSTGCQWQSAEVAEKVRNKSDLFEFKSISDLQSTPKMDELPELPFKQILGQLSLADRLKSRRVSRSWYHRINNSKVNSLCYSARPLGFIEGKSRWATGSFAQNFINSTRFTGFFDTFAPTILSNLKRLRLCDLNL